MCALMGNETTKIARSINSNWLKIILLMSAIFLLWQKWQERKNLDNKLITVYVFFVRGLSYLKGVKQRFVFCAYSK